MDASAASIFGPSRAGKEDRARILALLTPEEQTLIRLRNSGAEWEAIGRELGKDAAAVRQQFSRLQRKMAGMV